MVPLPPADVGAIRRHNLALVFRYVAEHGPCARTEIAAGTGLVHASITGLVRDLTARGLVRELDDAPVAARRAGRPRRMIDVAAGRVFVVGVQVSLEDVVVEIADLAGEVRLRTQTTHGAPHGDPLPVIDAIAAQIRAAGEYAVRKGAFLGDIVIAMAGPVDPLRGTVIAAIDFGWRHLPLVEMVMQRCAGMRSPIHLANDGDLAAFAEYEQLAATRGDDVPLAMLYVKADTGVGGGLMVGGQRFHGDLGTNAELGHVSIDRHGRQCFCGARGCLAMYVGPEVLVREAGLIRVREQHGMATAMAELVKRAQAGDEATLGQLAVMGERLGDAVMSALSLVSAGMVVLGGYLVDLWPWLGGQFEETLDERGALLRPEVILGQLGREATLRGALAFALRQIHNDPSGVPLLPVGKSESVRSVDGSNV